MLYVRQVATAISNDDGDNDGFYMYHSQVLYK